MCPILVVTSEGGKEKVAYVISYIEDTTADCKGQDKHHATKTLLLTTSDIGTLLNQCFVPVCTKRICMS